MKTLGGILAGFATLLLSTGFGATTVFRSPDNSFSVAAPVQLVTDGPKQMTTKSGQPFTTTFYSGWNNDSYYFVQSSTYPFAVTPEDLQRAIDGFSGVLNGNVTDKENLTVSGQPALRATITSPEVTFKYLVVYEGNKLLQLAYSGTGDPTAFFNSARLN